MFRFGLNPLSQTFHKKYVLILIWFVQLSLPLVRALYNVFLFIKTFLKTVPSYSNCSLAFWKLHFKDSW